MTKENIPADLAALESAVLNAAPEDETPVASMLAQGPGPDDHGPDPEGDYSEGQGGELISPEVWAEQWAAMHDMAGGMVQMRTGNPCPLGDQSRSAGGQMAAQAAYSLMASTPFLADLFLSNRSTFIGQVMVIGMHGFTCVQIVKASNVNTPPVDVAQ